MDIKDAIKIVYAWYGPKGPIWNTELPNILSFANVGEEVRTSSHNFWCDELWIKIFRQKKENYLLYPNSETTEDDIFIYPFSLMWRIHFQNYFFGNTGILEYGHVSPHIIHQVRAHKGFFLIDLSVEAFVQDDQLLAMHTYFNEIHGLPLNKIIYLTGCMNAQEIYDEFCARRMIPDRPDQRMNVISYPSSQNVYARQLAQSELSEPDYQPEYVPEKLFLCWNRRFRPHRTELALALNKAGLVDRSYYSLNDKDPEHPAMKFKSTIDLFNNPLLELKPEDANNLLSKVPLIIDNHTNIVQMCEDKEMLARNYYTNSLVSIVTETNYHLPEVTLTEKSFKPAKEKHPFIIVGSKNSLKSMKKLGYKTFGDFWDESYDDIADPKSRMKAIVDVCKVIGSWNEQQVVEFRQKVKPILEHNFNMLRTSPSEWVSEQIANTVRRNLP
jgi:hypothetical protein